MVALLVLAACQTDPVAAPDAGLGSMDPVDALIRTSLDLRGVRPSADELAQVEADPAALDTLVDVFLADPRFEGRVRDLWSEIYLTRSESFQIVAAQYGLDDQATFQESVGEESLRILGYIAAHDLPYTEIVTGDWTMADETLGRIWPVEPRSNAASCSARTC